MSMVQIKKENTIVDIFPKMDENTILQRNQDTDTCTTTAEFDTKDVCNQEECTDTCTTYTELDTKDISNKNLSKRAKKRLERKLRWESRKHEKRKAERLRKKCRLAEAHKQNIKLGPTLRELKQHKMATSACKTTVVIDMSFDHLMSEKDLGKTIKQILRVYSVNRRSPNPMQLYVTNFNGAAVKEMSKHAGYQNWDINFVHSPYLDVFKKESLVYLTSESENTIFNLEQDKVYIIGGLVDHNSQKGLCYRIAQEQHIAHAQLPIGSFIKMNSRKVLTIDQVFEILLRVTEDNSWEEALVKVLPARKGAKIVENGSKSASNDTIENSNDITENSKNIETGVDNR